MGPFSEEGRMPGCVLHVTGEAFDPEPVLATLALRPYSVFRKGQKCFPRNPKSQRRHRVGGFSCDVSSVDGRLAEEAHDAIAFLKRHHDDLARLGSMAAVTSMVLDFGYYLRPEEERGLPQSDYLPPELLRRAGELQVGIELSLYPWPGHAG